MSLVFYYYGESERGMMTINIWMVNMNIFYYYDILTIRA